MSAYEQVSPEPRKNGGRAPACEQCRKRSGSIEERILTHRRRLCRACAQEASDAWASALAPQCNQCHGGLLPAADGVEPLLRCDNPACGREVPAARFHERTGA